jgi:hypothetical protein
MKFKARQGKKWEMRVVKRIRHLGIAEDKLGISVHVPTWVKSGGPLEERPLVLAPWVFAVSGARNTPVRASTSGRSRVAYATFFHWVHVVFVALFDSW